MSRRRFRNLRTCVYWIQFDDDCGIKRCSSAKLDPICRHTEIDMFAKNAWYVACTPSEIDDKPLGRRICDEQIVFYRGPDGAVAALEDFCPHRGAPLSLGRVVEGRL